MAQTLTLNLSFAPTTDDLTGQAEFAPFSAVLGGSRTWNWNGTPYAADKKDQGSGTGKLPALPNISQGQMATNPLTVNVVCAPTFTAGTDPNGTWAYQPNTTAELAIVFGRPKKATGNSQQQAASPFNLSAKCTAVFYPTDLSQPVDGSGLQIALGTFSSASALNIGNYRFRVNLIVYLTYTPTGGQPVNYSISYGHDPDMQVES